MKLPERGRVKEQIRHNVIFGLSCVYHSALRSGNSYYIEESWTKTAKRCR
jgi:hypothetical protein